MVNASVAAGRLWIGPAWAIYVGPGMAARVHAHHAMQVVVPLRGQVRLRAATGPWRAYEAAVVGPDVEHESDRPVELIGTAWLEPEGRLAATFGPGRGLSPLPGGAVDEVRRLFGSLTVDPAPDPVTVVDELRRHVGAPTTEAPPIDPRVVKALAEIDAAAPARARLGAVAGETGLSPSRLGHLFSSEIGVPFRRYVLWRRLRAAVTEMSLGASATMAAHRAGFADSAHLSRTFHRMIGFTPSAGLSVTGSRFVQA